MTTKGIRAPIVLLFSACAAITAAQAAEDAQPIVVFGDSTTAPREGLVTYGERLEAALRERGNKSSVLNAGVSGNTTRDAAKRFRADVFEKRPQWVVIQFGINDSMVDVSKGKTDPRVSLAEYEKNLRRFVGELRDAGAKVVLMTPNPLAWTPKLRRRYGKAPYDPSHPWGLNATLNAYAAATRKVARETKTPLVDVMEAYASFAQRHGSSFESLLSDGMHPNQSGHDLVAKLLLATITESAEPKKSKASKSDWSARKIAGNRSGGAVLDLGEDGSFDAAWVSCPTILLEDGRYRMWYSSLFDASSGPGGIGMATSDDGIAWQRAGGPVLEVGPTGSLDDGQVMGPEVMRVGNEYWMWYTGMSRTPHESGFGYYRIFLATSDDGVQWQRANEGKPMIDLGPAGAADEVQAATPSILRDKNGEWWMWYSAWSPGSGHTVCVAKSHDGLTWTKQRDGKPVAGLRPEQAFGHAVVPYADGFLMLYMAIKAARGLFAATSKDGLAWTMVDDAPVLKPGKGTAFDSFQVGHPFLLAADDHFRVWYTGYQRQGKVKGLTLRIGLATIACQPR